MWVKAHSSRGPSQQPLGPQISQHKGWAFKCSAIWKNGVDLCLFLLSVAPRKLKRVPDKECNQDQRDSQAKGLAFGTTTGKSQPLASPCKLTAAHFTCWLSCGPRTCVHITRVKFDWPQAKKLSYLEQHISSLDLNFRSY